MIATGNHNFERFAALCNTPEVEPRRLRRFGRLRASPTGAVETMRLQQPTKNTPSTCLQRVRGCIKSFPGYLGADLGNGDEGAPLGHDQLLAVLGGEPEGAVLVIAAPFDGDDFSAAGIVAVTAVLKIGNLIACGSTW